MDRVVWQATVHGVTESDMSERLSTAHGILNHETGRPEINISNLRYADDTTLMAESEEKLKSLLIKVKKESEKSGLKLNIQKTKIMASGPITSWQIDEETMETVNGNNGNKENRFYFLGLQTHCRW